MKPAANVSLRCRQPTKSSTDKYRRALDRGRTCIGFLQLGPKPSASTNWATRACAPAHRSLNEQTECEQWRKRDSNPQPVRCKRNALPIAPFLQGELLADQGKHIERAGYRKVRG